MYLKDYFYKLFLWVSNMNKINKNGNLNSTGLTSNISKSKSKNEEQLKNTNKDNLISKIGQAIKQLKIASNDIKKSPPVNKLDMTKKISDPSSDPKKVVPKPLPKPPSKNLAVVSSNNSVAQKNKPLPDTPIKSKPLPVLPQQIMQSQPQRKPKPIVLATTLDVGLIVKQMKLFKNAINSQDGSQAELLAEQLNKYASDDKKVSAGICCKFAINIEKLARPNFTFTPEIKQSLVQFSSAWIAMKSAQGDPKGSAWDIVINTMALSIQEKSKEWGMEF